MKGIYFISGIDTNIGKSFATGWMASQLLKQGVSVITQKLIQTGNHNFSEDIELHRSIMGIPLTPEDETGLTCPVIFTYPASPHLAARIDRREVDTHIITSATCQLAEKYDVVLLEGAGGLMVPLTESLLTIDYVREQNYPVVLVTSGRLGSINHTFLSIEALHRRQMQLHSVIFNTYPECDELIGEDALETIRKYLQVYYPCASVSRMEHIAIPDNR